MAYFVLPREATYLSDEAMLSVPSGFDRPLWVLIGQSSKDDGFDNLQKKKKKIFNINVTTS